MLLGCKTIIIKSRLPGARCLVSEIGKNTPLMLFDLNQVFEHKKTSDFSTALFENVLRIDMKLYS
jgi:hypothetical protein